MKHLACLSFVLVCLCNMGCERKPAPPAASEKGPGVEVDAPGVHVEAGGGKGVEVEAPGVKVETPKE